MNKYVNKFTVSLASLAIALAVVAWAAIGPSKVTLSSSKWVCTSSKAVGLGAECLTYERKDR